VRSRLLLLAAAVLWSSAGAVIKLSALDAWQLAGGRALVAAAVLWVAAPAARRRPTGRLLLVGAAYAFTTVLFVVANKLTTSANAIFLQDTAPLWVLLLSPWALGERPSRGELLSIPVFGAGLALFFLDRLTAGQLAGNLVALAAGVAFAASILGLRRIGPEGPAALVWGNLLAAAVALPLWPLGPAAGAGDLGAVAFLGVFQLGLAYLCFSVGLRGTPALEASLLVLLEPVLNPVWTFLFAGERPGPWALAGGGIILLATVWRTLQPWLQGRRGARSTARAGA
jgi:drug/metabolite transporter (DMT)-like permease